MAFPETRLLLFPTIPLIPVPNLLLRAGLPVVGRTGVFLSLIILPIREDLLELIRLPELLTCGCVLRTLGFLVLIILPIREDLLELIRLPELPACGFGVPRRVGFLVLIELPIRELLLELIRLPEIADVCLPVTELTVVGLLLPIEMLDGLRVLEVIPDRIVTGRLTVTLPD